MSITGKSSLSIRKQDVQEQKSTAVGFKSLTFAHKASVGETGIDLGALVTPTEMSSNGFTNPTTNDLLASNIRLYRNNLIVTSSLRGKLMDYLSYRVDSSSRITFIGFTADEGEIFKCEISDSPRSDLQVVDSSTITASGELAIGVTDFNVGTPFRVGENASTSQIGEVKVYRNGLQQFRNTGNSDTVLDGNYYEVDNGSGLGTVIRFNNAPVGQADSILVTSVSGYAEKPEASQLAEIEKSQGQIDSMIPTLAALAGVPETDFQAAPNNQDLKQFGDRFIAVEEAGGGPKLATTSEEGAVLKNRIQEKIQQTDVTTDTTDISDLQFNNLTLGKRYRISGQVAWTQDAGDPNVTLFFFSQAGAGGTFYGRVQSNGDSQGSNPVVAVNVTFIADDTTLFCRTGSIGAGSSVDGDGTKSLTFIQLEELNNYETTTAWT